MHGDQKQKLFRCRRGNTAESHRGDISGCEVFRGHARNGKAELSGLARSKCRCDAGDKECALIGIRVSVGFFAVNTDIKADVRVSNALRVNDRENEVTALGVAGRLVNRHQESGSVNTNAGKLSGIRH